VTTKLSRWYRGSQAPHRAKMAQPMTREKMVTDPAMPAQERMNEERALLERRACQYATFLAQREGLFCAPTSAYDAHFDGGATVYFRLWESRGLTLHSVTITIPDHIMRFNPETPEPAVPAADVRCADTVDLEEAIAARDLP
jgi:hypothetical protein